MDNSLLYSVGTARGGTNLLNLILNVNDDVHLSQDPMLSLFKSFRNSLITSTQDIYLNSNSRDPLDSYYLPLDEYYYFSDKLRVMKMIQEANLDVKFNQSEIDSLRDSLANRMKLSSPLLIEHLNLLNGETYKELLLSAQKIMAKAWGTEGIKWQGFNENWAGEFIRPIANSFEDAKFIILVRDVRSAISSHINLVKHQSLNKLYQYDKDINMIAGLLSFCRCWRKQVAFMHHYKAAEFSDRVFLMRYEDLVTKSEEEVRRICTFLDINFSSEMLNTENFIAPDGGQWLPNSNHSGVPKKGIYSSTIDKWKSELDPKIISLIEFICGPELLALGYSVNNNFINFPSDAFEMHEFDHKNTKGWRTDNLNPTMDFGFELLRRKLLSERTRNKDLIEKCFLFHESYEALFSDSKER